MMTNFLLVVLFIAAIVLAGASLSAQYRRRAVTFVVPQGKHRGGRRTT
jgi:hypothetical protein